MKGKIATPINVWTQYLKNSVIKNIVDLSEILYLLFQRFRDEFDKNNEDIKFKPSKMTDLIENNLKEHFKISLEMSIIMDNYATFLFEQTEEDHSNLIPDAIFNVEKIYNELLQFFLGYPNLREKEVKEFMQKIEKQNSYTRIKTRLSDFSNFNANHTVIAQMETGRYFLNEISEFILDLGKDIWFEDYILNDYLLKVGINILENVLSSNPDIEDLELTRELNYLNSVELPNAKAFLNYNSAQLQTILAKIQLHNSDFQTASIDFKSALFHLDHAFNAIGMNPSNNRLKVLHQDSQKLFEEINLINLLVRLNLDFTKLLTHLEDNDQSETQNTIKKILNKLASHDFSLDIQYLSALPPLYNNTVSTIEVLLKNNQSYESIKEMIDQNFEDMERRIVTATNQLVEDFNSFSDQTERINSYYVRSKVDHIEVLQLTNSLLPNFIPSKNHNQNRLLILLHLAKSLEFELKAHQVSNVSGFKEMLFKTRAYHHANLAYYEINNLGTSNVPIERIKAHYSGSFISANRLQIDIYLSIAQYLCLNEVIPLLNSVVNLSNIDLTDEILYSYWQNKMKELDQFEEVMDHIIRSSQIIKEHRQIHGNVVVGINWDTIEIVENITRGISFYFDAIKELILGAIAVKSEKIEDAIIHFDYAKQQGFKSSDLLQILTTSNSELKNSATNIYNFSVFCQEFANNPKGARISDLPLNDAFKLLRDLIFVL